ncbi:MAG: hypothetical protein R3B45_09575 [Bdellovibrionota bacterium]
MRYEHPYLRDIIYFHLKPLKTNSGRIADLYLSKGHSAKQIADEFGVSKTSILECLHSMDIRSGSGKGRVQNPNNYRLHNPPYGYRRFGDQLVVCKKQLKLCKLVVQLIDDEKMSLNAVARGLTSLGYKNKQDKCSWDHSVVKAIYVRWKGKV